MGSGYQVGIFSNAGGRVYFRSRVRWEWMRVDGRSRWKYMKAMRCCHGSCCYFHGSYRRKSLMVKALLHPGRVIFLRKVERTAAAQATRWEYNCGHPGRVKRQGGYSKSRDVAMCTPRQQQQQRLKQQEMVKANVAVIGKRGQTCRHTSR